MPSMPKTFVKVPAGCELLGSVPSGTDSDPRAGNYSESHSISSHCEHSSPEFADRIKPLYIQNKFACPSKNVSKTSSVKSRSSNSKRSRRVKIYWEMRRNLKKACLETIFSDSTDNRPYVVVEISGTPMRGLLDSGASVSVLGQGSVEFLNKLGVTYKKIHAKVKTADGTDNRIIGYIDLDVKLNDKTRKIRLYLVPTLQLPVYFGIDFWNAFDIILSLNSLEQKTEPSYDKHTLSPSQQTSFDNILATYSSCEQHLGRTSLVEHHIDVGNNRPIKQRHYAVSPAIRELLYKELDRMLSLGVIEESMSSWSSPVVLIRKPNKIRLCLDSRKVNAVTEKDAYPLPLINGLLGRLTDTSVISSIDLKDAFWQIPLDEASKDKTAFTVPGRPLYHFTVMPFGLCNSPQTMCRLMDKVVPHLLHDKVFVYLDDLLVTSSSIDEHLELLNIIGKRLKDAGLTINLSKSRFFMKRVKYLGFIVGDGGLKTDPEKVEAIRNFPPPTSLKQTRRLLGMTGWYQRFIPNYSEVTTPITELLKKNKTFVWTKEAQAAFEKLKFLLSSAPVLTNPNYTKPFYIRCDACKTGVGSVLFQKDDNDNERPIAYMSKKLNSAQSNYTTTELECLAAVLSIKKFRPYVEGHHFTVITDHSSLKWLMSQTDLNGRLARWSLKLQAFDFEIQHQRGTQNIVPDTLSRMYCDSNNSTSLCQIDLSASSFQEFEYVNLRKKILAAPANYTSFKVIDDRLYIKVGFKIDPELSDIPLWKLWVPSTLTDSIIKDHHDVPLAAHGGILKTLERIRKLYYWPGMRKQIYDYVNKCEICKITKAANSLSKPPLGRVKFAERPWQKLYVDLMGPYPRSKTGNTFILVILDQFSKFVLLKPLSSSTTNKIITYLRNEVFLLFGVPEVVHTDNGSQFISKSFQELLNEFNIVHIKTAVYSPQANASERVNRSVIAAIRAYVSTDHKTWDHHLGEVACSLRSAVHQSTQHPPYFLVFGYNMITNGQHYGFLRDLHSLNENIERLPMADRLSIIHETVMKNLEKAWDKYAKHYNLRTRPIIYKPGQIVYVKLHPLSDASKNICAKFTPKFTKAIVHEKIGSVNYKLTDESGKTLGTFHAKDIKL